MTHPATLLKNSWRAYARDFRAWLLLTSPLAVLSALAIVKTRFMPEDQTWSIATTMWGRIAMLAGALVAVAVVILVARVFSTAITISSYRSLNGQKVNVKESIIAGWRTFWPVLWVAILRGLIIAGGLLLLVIPGIIWALRYSLAVQAAAIEGKKGMAALHRSADLTRGKLLETFVNIGVIGAIVGYGSWLFAIIVMAIFIVLGNLVSLVVSAEAANIIYFIVVAITAVCEAAIVWVAIPLSPLAITAVYKDFSDK